jgi:hypothetical protein
MSTGTMAERHARLKYWAIVLPPNCGRKLSSCIGRVRDFYPHEEVRHYDSYVQQGYTIIGTYDDADTAMAAASNFMKTICKRMNANLQKEGMPT